MIDWTKSMEQTFEYYLVDPNTWKDMKQLTTVKSCSISREDDSETLGSASLDIIDSLGECYVRVYMTAIQNEYRERVCFGTFLVQTPSMSYDGKIKSMSVDAYTPLLELKENQPPLGYALLKDDNIMSEAYRIARENCRAPVVENTSDKKLQSTFVANTNDTWLTYIQDLIAQAKFKFYLDDEGRILFAPIQKVEELKPIWTFNDDNSSILQPEVYLDNDLYGIPNVVEVIASTGTGLHYAIAKNEDPNSPTSIQSRGRVITYRDTNPSLPGFPTAEQIDEYAKDLLESMSSIECKISYSHGYCPVRVGDCVRINYNAAGLTNIKAKVVKQTFRCESGCIVSETAVFTKKLWNN